MSENLCLYREGNVLGPVMFLIWNNVVSQKTQEMICNEKQMNVETTLITKPSL